MDFEVKMGIINHVVILIIALSLAVSGFLVQHNKGNSVSFIEDDTQWIYSPQEDILTGLAIADLELEEILPSSEKPNKTIGLSIFAQLFALMLSMGVLIVIRKKRKMNGCV